MKKEFKLSRMEKVLLVVIGLILLEYVSFNVDMQKKYNELNQREEKLSADMTASLLDGSCKFEIKK